MTHFITVKCLIVDLILMLFQFQKVLKSNWQPRGTDRIIKHDHMVQKNWELLRNGKLELSPELKEHIMQFTRRSIPADHQVPGNIVCIEHHPLFLGRRNKAERKFQ